MIEPGGAARGVRPLAVVLLLLVLGAPRTFAEDVRRLEAVGVVPLRPDQRGAGALDEAIQAALLEAVTRVARSFLMDAELSEGETEAEDGSGDEDLARVLGKRMVPYTSRFRILDDRGERPAMFAQDPGVTREYVVVVEVHVDGDRVKERLIEAGLLKRADDAGVRSRVALEVRGLWQYGAYQALRRLLTEEMGASAAMPRGFKRGVALLDVELMGSANATNAAEVAEWLVEQQSPELLVHVVEVDQERLAIAVDWTPPAHDPAPVGAWR